MCDYFGHFSYENCYSGIFIKSSKMNAVGMVQNGHFYFVQLFLDIFGHFPHEKIVAADFYKKSENGCSGYGAKWTFLFSGLFWNCCSGFL
jgi:hypothetical protein